MNPSIPTDSHETEGWLAGFLRSHAKRESPRIEVILERGGSRQGRSCGVRLSLDGRVHPDPGSPPIEFDLGEVAAGRTRFAWCASLAERIRAVARELLGTVRSGG